MNKLIIGNLNINSIPEKFDQLKVLISKNLDILVITETKLDSTFPVTQFLIEGYKLYWIDRNRHGGGILVYVREGIPSKELSKHTQPSDIEGIFLEINLRKTRWLLFACYHPSSQSDDYFFKNVGNSLDLYFQDYSKFLLVGDFNAVETEPCLSKFLNQYDSRSLGKASTSFKNPQNPSCIDLIITNSPKSFQNTESIPTGLSDFHNMVVSVLKSKVPKGKPKEIFYRNYKNFDNSNFKAELRSEIELNQISDYNNFENVFLRVLEKHAPLKKKLVRANEAPYITKTLRKAIMRRSQLENKYRKQRTRENKTLYKKQKNVCSRLYKKERAKYYANLDIKKITDNKTFWKTIKPFLSNKSTNSGKILLSENETILTDEETISETFNDFFKKSVEMLQINENKYQLDNVDDMSDPIQIAITKFQNHPSILLIKENVQTAETFHFSPASIVDIEKEILALNASKVGTFKNIPAKLIKETSDVCGKVFLDVWNSEIIDKHAFPTKLKLADIIPIHKKMTHCL